MHEDLPKSHAVCKEEINLLTPSLTETSLLEFFTLNFFWKENKLENIKV